MNLYLCNMLNVSSYIQKRIEKVSSGAIIQMSDFNVPADKRMAMAKELSRLAQKGVIARLEKGRYYKPRLTIFGELKPTEDEVLKSILKTSNGYIGGATSFNQLGLTTQVSNTITIVVSDYRPPKEIAGLKIKFKKSELPIDEDNTFILQILDSLRYINRIPDSSVDESLKVIVAKIKSLPNAQKRILLNYALEYNPATRALTGAIFELNCSGFSTSKLYKSLNPLSKYRLGVSVETLPNKSKWRIE